MNPAIPATPAAYPPGYAPPPTPAAPVAPVPVVVVPPPGTATGPREPVPDEEIRLYGHSNLFYWWPVWVVAFLMAGLTYLDGHVMAVVPSGTKVEPQAQRAPDGQSQAVLVAPPGQPVPPASAYSSDPTPHLRVAANNNYGVVFTGTLLLIVMITNFTLRGLASVIAIAGIIVLALLFLQLGWWEAIFRWLGGVDVRINAGGYLAVGIPLLLIWLFSTFIYDHYTYLIITRGQVRIRQAIGDGEIAVDSSGLSLEKKRNDLFRHWLVGLGSGDLHVKTGGPANLDFELNNVLFVGWKIAKAQDMLREKEVAEQAAGG